MADGTSKGMSYAIALIGGVVAVVALTTMLPTILTNLNTSITALTSYDSGAGALAGLTYILIPLALFSVLGYFIYTKVSR